MTDLSLIHPPSTPRWLARLSCLAAAALLAGCAAMSEEECRSANWYDRGVRDAQSGHGRGYLGDIREACAKAGVQPNAALYLQGWEQGIQRFCTPENGARWGRQGHYYGNTCPAPLDGPFSDAYRAGKRVWEAEQALNRLQSEQRDKQRKLEWARDDKARKEAREELRDIDRRLRDAREDLDRAEWRMRHPY